MQLGPRFDPSVIDRFLKLEFTSPPGIRFQNTKRREPQNITVMTSAALPAKIDSDVMFWLQSYQGLMIDWSLVY